MCCINIEDYDYICISNPNLIPIAIMLKIVPAIAAATALILSASCTSKSTEKAESESIPADSVEILYRAFSHNDYSRPGALTEALANGFNCVEADCYLVDGRMLVAHDLPEDPSTLSTLQEMYMDSLFSRIDRIGSVYPGAEKPFYLMIDIKRDGDEFYTALRPYLAEHADKFCRVENGKFVEGPILLFFSGARPMETLPNDSIRYAFLDGKFSEIGNGTPTTLVPVVSDNYEDFMTWDGTGEIDADNLAIMRDLISRAHKDGKLIRFWGAPDTEAWADLQIAECVDIIGTDNLPQLRAKLAK